jgi:uncharacterized membrane protein YfcA
MTWVLIGVAAVCAFSAFAQIITGFGFALVGIPLVAALTDAVTAVVAVTVLSTALTAGAAAHQRHLVDWRATRVVTATAVVGLPIGLLAVRTVETRWLDVLIGAVVLFFAVALARGLQIRGRGVTPSAGILSGALLTSTGMNGPPVVVAFQNQGMEPARFRATLQAVFSIQGGLAVAGFALAGVIGNSVWPVAGAGAPAMLIGWWLGHRVADHVNKTYFRRIVLCMLAATGCASLLTGLVI